MSKKLMIIMVNTDPRSPAELGAPFFQATVAAAMGFEVEVILTARAGELATRGVAESVRIDSNSDKNVYDYIREASEAGVQFKVCTPTIELWGNDLIPEISEVVGGAYLIGEAMNDQTVTFTY